MLIAAVVTVVSMFLPWNYEVSWVNAPGGGIQMERGEAINLFTQIGWNLDAERFYGYLQLAAAILAIIASLVIAVVAIMALTSRPRSQGLGVAGLTTAIIGLLATLGVFAGYALLGALGEAAFGMYLYAVAFVPGLIGAIGLKKGAF